MPDVITGLACPNCAGALSVREASASSSARIAMRARLCAASAACAATRWRAASSASAPPGRARFWRGLNRAFDLSAKAQIGELFLAYLPYWRAQSQMAGWIFGEKRVSSGKSFALRAARGAADARRRLDGAAADVAEFGVERIGAGPAPNTRLRPRSPSPAGYGVRAHRLADRGQRRRRPGLGKYARGQSGLDRVGQTLLRFLRRTLALVYYPLWVGRYTIATASTR